MWIIYHIFRIETTNFPALSVNPFSENLSAWGTYLDRYLHFSLLASLMIHQTGNDSYINQILPLRSDSDPSNLVITILLKASKTNTTVLLKKLFVTFPLILFSIHPKVRASVKQRQGMMFVAHGNHRWKFSHLNFSDPVFASKRFCGCNDGTACITSMNRDIFRVYFAVINHVLEISENVEIATLFGFTQYRLKLVPSSVFSRKMSRVVSLALSLAAVVIILELCVHPFIQLGLLKLFANIGYVRDQYQGRQFGRSNHKIMVQAHW